jgi:hypothetical protein
MRIEAILMIGTKAALVGLEEGAHGRPLEKGFVLFAGRDAFEMIAKGMGVNADVDPNGEVGASVIVHPGDRAAITMSGRVRPSGETFIAFDGIALEFTTAMTPDAATLHNELVLDREFASQVASLDMSVETQFNALPYAAAAKAGSIDVRMDIAQLGRLSVSYRLDERHPAFPLHVTPGSTSVNTTVPATIAYRVSPPFDAQSAVNEESPSPAVKTGTIDELDALRQSWQDKLSPIDPRLIVGLPPEVGFWEGGYGENADPFDPVVDADGNVKFEHWKLLVGMFPKHREENEPLPEIMVFRPHWDEDDVLYAVESMVAGFDAGVKRGRADLARDARSLFGA